MAERFALTRRALLASSFLTLAVPAFGQGQPAYRNPSAPVADRVRDLLARMTLEEKAAQMRCLWLGKFGILDKTGHLDAAKAEKALANGVGQVARPGDTMGTAEYRTKMFRDPASAVTFHNEVQRYLVEQTRLGIPALFHEETAHGLMADDVTVFPIPPALASSWDPALVEQVFTVAARQARMRGATVGLSPVLDLMREPRFGRAEEFFSEDPHLTGQMGIAAVRGLQGRQRPLGPDRVFATLKHFIHGSPQGGINLAPAEVSERTLRENYLVPFAEVIKEADPAIVMPSYNEVGGVPAHANLALLQQTGRERLGFKGAYFSDYGGVTNLVVQHHMAANNDDAAVLAIKAGVDAELPDGEAYAHIPDLVRGGRISEAQVDAAVARILAMKFEAGLFENPYADAGRALRASSQPADAALARLSAERAIVLLKNDGILPLDPTTAKRLAVIGPNAFAPQFGGYSGRSRRPVSVLDGIKAGAGRRMTVEFAEGVRITQHEATGGRHGALEPVPPAENTPRIEEAVALAQRSDVVLLVLGDRPEVTRESVKPEDPGDRNTLNLFGDQDRLVDAILATGKPVVALLLHGRPLAVPTLAERANALLSGWFLGEAGGTAFSDVLFGKVNPGGKLTVSLPRGVGDLPVFYNRHPSADINRYVEGKREALFPFGHGLSYTTFEISAPRLSKDRIARNESLKVAIDVTNTGRRPGDEVVQIYVRDQVSSVPRPVLELRAFRRVTLKPGETRTLQVELGPDDLAFWDIDMNWTVEPGTFSIFAGSSSIRLKSADLAVVESV
ncbi:MAG: glycoside hydrolase family 3 N-terminal domain-containing protein [Novosphingobium sp.]